MRSLQIGRASRARSKRQRELHLHHAESAAHLVRRSPAHSPHPSRGPAHRREQESADPSQKTADAQARRGRPSRGRWLRRSPTPPSRPGERPAATNAVRHRRQRPNPPDWEAKRIARAKDGRSTGRVPLESLVRKRVCLTKEVALGGQLNIDCAPPRQPLDCPVPSRPNYMLQGPIYGPPLADKRMWQAESVNRPVR